MASGDSLGQDPLAIAPIKTNCRGAKELARYLGGNKISATSIERGQHCNDWQPATRGKLGWKRFLECLRSRGKTRARRLRLKLITPLKSFADVSARLSRIRLRALESCPGRSGRGAAQVMRPHFVVESAFAGLELPGNLLAGRAIRTESGF